MIQPCVLVHMHIQNTYTNSYSHSVLHINIDIGIPRSMCSNKIEHQKYNTQPAAVISSTPTPKILRPAIFILTVVF